MSRTVPTLLRLALLIVVASALLLTFSREPQDTNPSAASYGPTGTAAFAELLRQTGYKVRLERSQKAELETDEIAIAVFLDSEFDYIWQDAPIRGDDFQSVWTAIWEHASAGGKAVVTRLSTAQPPKATELPQAVESAFSHKTERVIVPDVAVASTYPNLSDGVLLWRTKRQKVAQIHSVGKGQIVTLRDGYAATNRFIDQADDASFWLGLVNRLGMPGRTTVVFLEAAHGKGEDPSILQRVGQWAILGWWQFLVLIFVVGFGLGRPFGLPPAARVASHGGREMADAIKSILQRTRRFGVALELLRRQALRAVRRKRGETQSPDWLDHGFDHMKESEAIEFAKTIDKWSIGQSTDEHGLKRE